jgi:predicted MFS family arabinose efflux permease
MQLSHSISLLLVSNPVFISIPGFFVPFVYIVNYAILVGTEPKTAAYLLSVLGLLNVIGRIVAGFIADRAWVDCLWINNFALVLAGVLTLIAPFCTHFAHLVAYACGFGICIGR